MGLDIEKLKQFQIKFNQDALKEIYEELPESFVKFSNSSILNYCLQEYKLGAKAQHSPRVLNSWINNEIIKINIEDRGKVRRFNKLENIWLNIIMDARKFGIPINILKQSRKELLESPIKNFSLLKFGILETILRSPKTLLIFEEGQSSLFSLETYTKWVSKGLFPVHIAFRIQDYIALEYPKNAFSVDFNIADVYEDKNKINLLYFLKTGDYKYIKLYITNSDIRIIEDSNALAKNPELMKVISDWNFQKVEIVINNEVETSIIL